MNALYTATTDTLKISIYQDLEPINPLDDWDCEPPAVWASYGYGGIATFQGDESLLLPSFRDGFIPSNLNALAKIAGLDFSFNGLRAIAENGRGNYPLIELIEDEIQEAIDAMPAGDRMDALASIYRLQGIPALATCSNGLSQGDYVDLLLVAKNEWRQRLGVIDLEASANLFRRWHEGDCYGAVIEKKCQTCGQPSTVDESCWGFYGDFETSGLFDFIKGSAGQEALDAIKEAI